MKNQQRVETINGFSTYTIYSQLAGICALTITNFLEVTKIRLIQDSIKCSEMHYQQKLFTRQLLEKITKKGDKIIPKITKKCLNCLPDRSGFFALNHILKTDGLKYILTKGLVASFNSSIIRIGLFFPIMDFFKVKLQKNKFFQKQNQMVTTLTASSASRFITTLMSFPFEVSKIKQQSNAYSNLNIWKSFKIIHSNPREYASIFFTFFQRELIFTLIFWFNFDLAKIKLSQFYGKDQEDFSIKLPAAFYGGLISSFMTYPFDLIQTNMILDSKQQKFGSLKILKNLYNNYGFSSLMNGLSFRMLRGGSQNIIFFTVYDSCKQWEKKYLVKQLNLVIYFFNKCNQSCFIFLVPVSILIQFLINSQHFLEILSTSISQFSLLSFFAKPLEQFF